MVATARFLCVAVGVSALLYLVALVLKLNVAHDAIVFGFVGVVSAIVVESVLKLRSKPSPRPRKKRR